MMFSDKEKFPIENFLGLDSDLTAWIRFRIHQKTRIRNTGNDSLIGPIRIPYSQSQPALWIRIRMFLGLPDPDPLVRGTEPDPDPSINKQK
jgi:hypothetical protein